MQDLIKRYFWVVTVVAVMLCAMFAAKATASLIEASVLADAKQGPKITPVARAEPVVKPTRTKDGGQLATRNVFCSECTPPPTATNVDPSAIAITGLPLVLLATNVGSTPEESYATIVNTESQKQGAFTVDDPMPGASGKITSIHYKFVDFENNGRMERLVLQGAVVPTTPVAAAEQPATGDGENKDELQASIDSGIKKLDETTYEIEKSLVDKVLLNPMAIVKGARVVPAMKNGKPEGFKMYAIRPTSAFAKLGLSNGDTLTSINGFELTSADKALEVYTKLREATSLELEVTRRGKPVTLKYSIR
ncbi:MAG TPA: type II secretion system protein GspC [Kofleriaceae bacterium]|nr:type II secretion system protein GspC [Kofleriaceae bacterium]